MAQHHPVLHARRRGDRDQRRSVFRARSGGDDRRDLRASATTGSAGRGEATALREAMHGEAVQRRHVGFRAQLRSGRQLPGQLHRRRSLSGALRRRRRAGAQRDPADACSSPTSSRRSDCARSRPPTAGTFPRTVSDCSAACGRISRCGSRSRWRATALVRDAVHLLEAIYASMEAGTARNTVPGQFGEWFDGGSLTNRGMYLSPWTGAKYLWAVAETVCGLDGYRTSGRLHFVAARSAGLALDRRGARSLGRPPAHLRDGPCRQADRRRHAAGVGRRALSRCSSPGATSATRPPSRRSRSAAIVFEDDAGGVRLFICNPFDRSRNVAIEFRGRMIRRRIEAGAMLELVLSGNPQLRDAIPHGRAWCMRSRRPRTALMLVGMGIVLLAAVAVGQQVGEHTIFGATERRVVVPQVALTPVPEDTAGTDEAISRNWKRLQVVAVSHRSGVPGPARYQAADRRRPPAADAASARRRRRRPRAAPPYTSPPLPGSATLGHVREPRVGRRPIRRRRVGPVRHLLGSALRAVRDSWDNRRYGFPNADRYRYSQARSRPDAQGRRHHGRRDARAGASIAQEAGRGRGHGARTHPGGHPPRRRRGAHERPRADRAHHGRRHDPGHGEGSHRAPGRGADRCRRSASTSSTSPKCSRRPTTSTTSTSTSTRCRSCAARAISAKRCGASPKARR